MSALGIAAVHRRSAGGRPPSYRRRRRVATRAACFAAVTGGILAGVTPLPRFHIVLVQPEIPQNTGNIGRTCVALGAKLWLVRPLGFRLDNHRLERAGMDYWTHLDWEAVDSWAALLAETPVGAARRWFFTKTAARRYTDAAFRPGDALVFGSESGGLPPSLMADAGDAALQLPMREEARSLNLSSCVAAAAYEALRQMDSV
ncbi:MAG: tRNA (cytidine(34)-2'-O)-methyltransferase [Planctomycetales bacterium]|nr:tRNA (cytidine(34)-2'-O)-methyltransferase [Planctomycetales bacterium]